MLRRIIASIALLTLALPAHGASEADLSLCFKDDQGPPGYSTYMALRTGNAAAAQAATFAFFPLIFLSTTFVPEEYITSDWLRWAARINPTTYVFEAMRSLLIDGWQARPLLIGLAVVIGFATLTGGIALRAARRATELTK